MFVTRKKYEAALADLKNQIDDMTVQNWGLESHNEQLLRENARLLAELAPLKAAREKANRNLRRAKADAGSVG